MWYTCIYYTTIYAYTQYTKRKIGKKIKPVKAFSDFGCQTHECTRCFSRVIGQPPIDYLNHYRIRQAAGMLVETDLPIGMISEKCGFVSDSYFGKIFKETMGCTPRSYRRGEYKNEQ